jgi:two-component system response regulator GlrR
MGSLPRHPPAATTEDPKMLATNGSNLRRSLVSPRPARRAARVLVVEDDPEMRHWVAEALTEEGFETSTAADALTGVMSLLSDGADVVVTDWRMPGYDGLRLLESARRICPATRIVFVTAYPEPGLHAKIREQGAFSLLEKPFRRDELILHVHSALRVGEAEPM